MITCYPHARACRWLAVAAAVLALNEPAAAHFGVILPADDIVEASEARNVALRLQFRHPFEGHFMDMARPARFGVMVRGAQQDLLPALREQLHGEARAWKADYTIQRPGDHIFFMEPAPYFEPAESSFIVHYTKVVVHALGLESGWDEPLGLATEIIPLTRPYGLWVGNLFQGIVMVDGQPAPFAEVEVEHLNESGMTAPAAPFVTQVVKADGDGVFSYAMPGAGWWGFAALSTAAETMQHTDGEEYPVEIGAVLWVRTHAMP